MNTSLLDTEQLLLLTADSSSISPNVVNCPISSSPIYYSTVARYRNNDYHQAPAAWLLVEDKTRYQRDTQTIFLLFDQEVDIAGGHVRSYRNIYCL